MSMHRRNPLFLEQRIAIIRRRLNHTRVDKGFTCDEWRAFALNAIDVLDGDHGALTDEERKLFDVK